MLKARSHSESENDLVFPTHVEESRNASVKPTPDESHQESHPLHPSNAHGPSSPDYRPPAGSPASQRELYNKWSKRKRASQEPKETECETEQLIEALNTNSADKLERSQNASTENKMERQEDKAKDTARERSLLDAARPRQKKRKGDPKAKRQVDEDNANFELFDEVLDWTYGKTPPPNVCLSDYHVGEAVIYASRETRRRFWPKDFDIAGLIRKARVNVGTAAKFLESANDTWYYRIWLGYYVLQGSEGKEKTVLGDPDKVRKRSGIYFDKGPKAKIQEPPFPQLKVQSISQTQIIDDVANGISSRDVRKKTSATRPEVSHSRRTGWNDSDKWDGIPARSTISRTPSNPWGLRNIKPKPRDPESKAIIARLIQEVRQIDVVTQNRLETEGQAIDVLGENLTTLRKNLSVVYNQLTDGLTIMTRQVEGLSEFIEMTKRSATLNKTADNALESLAGIEGFFSLKDTMLDFTPIVQPVQIPGFDFEPPNDNADADKEEEGNEHSGSEATIPED